ncbi:SpoIIE family protein phosphatase [Microbacterium sp. JZ31]|uniref:SpoIIE family protein phosphatase n=1 Tax=Microbacterium sp. JZ31 TaxID=1906274 RepID=UPI0019326477|nr:GAF domain-containing SpoIIE family protein phosphatase [Microbacterium sp. JZ31]
MTDLAGTDEAVERLGLMDTPPEERFDRITRLAQEVFDVDKVVMNVVNSATIYTKSQPDGSHFRHTPPEDSFCAETMKQDGVLEVPDGAEDPRFAHRGIVAEHGVRFYAGFPIRTEAGETVATLCLLDPSPGKLSDEDLDAFERFGRWAQAEIRHGDPAAFGAGDAQALPVAPSTDEDSTADGEVRVASLSIPFNRLSGDRSAWMQLEGKVVVTLADVMGKGPVASGLAEELIAALQERRDLDPVEALLSVEDQAREVPAYQETFATLFHAVIDTTTGVVDYVDAGHGLTLLLGADGTVTRLFSRNLPLGLRPGDVEWESGRVTVRPGDVIVSVSDGALDAYDSTLASLQMIAEDLRRARGVTNDFFVRLAVRVSEHTVDDDVTAMIVSIH